MAEFIIKGSFQTKEEESEIKNLVQEKGFEFQEIKKDQEAKILPKDIYKQKDLLRKELIKVSEQEFLKTVEDFFDTHAVEFKKNNVEIPTYIQYELDSEYDDNGGSYLYLCGIQLYDANKKRIRCNFEVKTSWGTCELEELLQEELQETVDSDYIDDIFYNVDYIKIPKGV